MSINYISPLLHCKRGREGDQDEIQLQQKRVCNGLESCVQVRYGNLTESSMDTWEAQQVIPQQDTSIHVSRTHHVSTQGLAAQSGSAQQCCPRCMAGEPGHINHIMQRY